MAQNKLEALTPVAIGTAAANILAPAAAGASAVGYTPTASYLIVTRLRIVNTTTAIKTVQLFIGATGASAAGSEFLGSGIQVPANSYIEWFGRKRLAGASGFLTGLASALGCTIEGDFEVGLV